MEYIINSLQKVNFIEIILIVTIGPIVSYFIQQWLKNLKTPIKAEFCFQRFCRTYDNGPPLEVEFSFQDCIVSEASNFQSFKQFYILGCMIKNILPHDIELSRESLTDILVDSRDIIYFIIDGKESIFINTFTLSCNKTVFFCMYPRFAIRDEYISYSNVRYVCDNYISENNKTTKKEIIKRPRIIYFDYLGKKRKCKIKFPKKIQDDMIKTEEHYTKMDIEFEKNCAKLTEREKQELFR